MKVDARKDLSAPDKTRRPRRRCCSKFHLFRCLYWVCDTIGKAFEVLMLILGPILVVLAQILIWLVVWVYFVEVYPCLVERYERLEATIITAIGVWLASNIVVNHLGCLIVGPGFAPLIKGRFTGDQLDSFTLDPEVGEGKSGPRSCYTCKMVKPWRTHHCQICGRCVLRMDHHCPWMNRCVGYYNYCYFYLFILYLWFGTLFFLYFGNCVESSTIRRKETMIDLFFFLVLGIFCATCIFLTMHCFLLLTNQTTIEVFGSSRKNRRVKLKRLYSLGSAGLNVGQVFGGERWYMWLVPVFWRRRIIPNEPGFVYPVRAEVKVSLSGLNRLLPEEV